MTPFQFEENDIIGEQTLSVISEANHFNAWMYQTIKPYCKGNILEIGSGIGNISKYFLDDGFSIFLSDIRSGYCDDLQEKFKNKPTFLGVIKLDLVDPAFDSKYVELFNKFDTIFALNVVEHIEDDTLAIFNCSKLLKPRGHIIILVPSYNILYNKFDENLGHYRRYNKKSLAEIFQVTSLKIIHQQYFNLIGIFGWYISGSILRKESIPQGQMALYNKLVPFFKLVDKLMLNTFGLSTIIVGKKQP